MMRLCSLLLCAVVVLNAWASDWPQFRGANGSGISPETGINKDWNAKPPKELWRFTMRDKGYAGAAVAAGKVFLLDPDGKNDAVRALDLKTGRELWKFEYPSVYSSMIGDGGSPDWGLGRSTPTYDEGRVYALGALGKLHCLDAETGAKIWMRDIKADFKGKPGEWHYAAPPIVDGKKLIVCPAGDNAGVVALDKMTGADIWKGGGSDKAAYAVPIIATLDGKRQYVVMTCVTVMGVDPENGNVLWTAPWKTQYDTNTCAPIIFGDSVFISSGEKHGCMLLEIKGTTATKLWENKHMQSQFNAGVLAGGFVYGTTDPGKLMCLDLGTGIPCWELKGFEKGGVMAIDGTLIAVDGKTGDVVMFELERKAPKELGRIKPLDGRHWSPPFASDGKLFIRNRETLVCLDLK